MRHRVWFKRFHFVVLLMLATGCVTTLVQLQPTWSWRDLMLCIFVGVLYGIADARSVRFLIPGWVGPGIDDPAQPREIHINVTEAAFIFAVLAIGPIGILPLLIATTYVTRVVRKRWWIEVGFNATLLAISYTMALAILRLFATAGFPLAVAAGGVAIFVLVFFVPLWDAWTFSLLILVRSGRPYRQVLAEIFGPEVLIAVIPLSMGALGAIAWAVNPSFLLLAAAPVVFAHRALHAVATWTEEHAHARLLARQLQEANRTLDERVQQRTAELAHLHEQRVVETTEAMHDIRHRLSALETAFDVLALQLPAAMQQSALANHTLESARRALHAVYIYLATVLDAVRLQSGAVTIWPESLDAAALFEQTQQQLGAQFNVLHCSFHLTQPQCPALVVADRKRLERVVFNLLDNAAKFAADHAGVKGGASITVWFAVAEGCVGCHIQDNGPGLTAEEVQRLGERGVRLGVDPRRIEGNGLGLSFCFRALAGMGGRLQVESAGRGQGSTFTVWLPQATPGQSPAQRPGDQSDTGSIAVEEGSAR